MVKVDSTTAVPPLITNTWVFTLVKGLVRKVAGGRQADGTTDESDSEDASTSEMSASDYDNGSAKGRRAANKAGGMRKKAVRTKTR